MKRNDMDSRVTQFLYTTDYSWPILKCLVECPNKEKLEDYLVRSYKIVSGRATEIDLPVRGVKTSWYLPISELQKWQIDID